MIDFNKYRQMSPFYDLSGEPKTKRDITFEQALMEFDFYQQYMPNTHKIYINDSIIPILGTMVDVTDLEARSDSKWVFTSLNNKIYCGDIIKWDNNTWMCIYDKLKNVKTCYKSKIQPCKTMLRLPFYQLDVDGNKTNIPIVINYPILTNVYLTDMQESNSIMSKDSDWLGVCLKYDKYTSLLDKQSRIFLYDRAWEITGIDYTNINFLNADENGDFRGYLRLMIKVSKIESADNIFEKVCDYYKYYDTTTPLNNFIQGNQNVTVLNRYDYSIINDSNKTVQWILSDINNNSTNLATIISQSNNSCKIKCNTREGIIKLSTICTEDVLLESSIQINIKSLL